MSLSEGRLLFISNADTWQHGLQSSLDKLHSYPRQRLHSWLMGTQGSASEMGDSLSSSKLDCVSKVLLWSKSPSQLMSFQVLGPSLFKRSEFVEGMPEEGWLPLGFCQGKDLLLRDAGRHSDVSLVKGVQGLVWRRHRTPIIAHTCRKNSWGKHLSQPGKFKHRIRGHDEFCCDLEWQNY